MKYIQFLLAQIMAGALVFTAATVHADVKVPLNIPQPQEGEFVHVPPTMEDLKTADLHPELKRVIRRGHDLFMNTQQLRDKNVFNGMNCSSCHMGEGREPFAGPVWPAAVVLPGYRGKNDHVNNLEERIAGCFSFSMNGTPPAYGSDDMVALATYHRWLASGVPIYASGKNIYGRGYPRLAEPEKEMDYQRGKQVYEDNCVICHASDGAGLVQDGKEVFPAVWGDRSYNWGAGMTRHFTLSSFIKHNMPLGKPNSLSDQQAWDVAYYINNQERPQEPRFEGSPQKTREKYLDTFHKHTSYGLKRNGKVLGDHKNTGEKDFLKPDVLRPRTYTAD